MILTFTTIFSISSFRFYSNNIVVAGWVPISMLILKFVGNSGMKNRLTFYMSMLGAKYAPLSTSSSSHIRFLLAIGLMPD